MLHHYNKVKEKRLEDGKVREGTKESDPKEPSADASNLLQIEVQGRLRDNSYYEANKNSKGNNVLPESEFNTNAMFKPTSKELDKSLSHANKKKKAKDHPHSIRLRVEKANFDGPSAHKDLQAAAPHHFPDHEVQGLLLQSIEEVFAE
jgi:hypothetical protein